MSRNVSDQMVEINNLHKRHEAIYRDYAAGLGFSDMCFWIMYALCMYKRPITQYELVKDWGFSKQTINSATFRLLKDGYIEAHETSDNRKKKMLELTTKGEDFCQSSVYPMIFAERASLNNLSMEERDFFINVYSKQMDFLENAIAPVKTKNKKK